MGTREIMVGTQETKVEMRGIRVGMCRMRGMQGIRVGMRGIRVGMWRMEVKMRESRWKCGKWGW